MYNFVLQSKRKEIRIPYSGTVRFSADQFNWYLNKAQNISRKGIFIKTEEEFKVGTKLYLNFDLIVNDEVVKKIRTIGEVMRCVHDGEKGSGVKNSGLGIHFSLLPGQEIAMRTFVEDVMDASLEESAKHIGVAVQDKTVPLLRWWLQEVANKLLSTNGLILELTVILIFIVVGVMLFL
jgi:Tfp pilus assembly protein PilZ